VSIIERVVPVEAIIVISCPKSGIKSGVISTPRTTEAPRAMPTPAPAPIPAPTVPTPIEHPGAIKRRGPPPIVPQIDTDAPGGRHVGVPKHIGVKGIIKTPTTRDMGVKTS